MRPCNKGKATSLHTLFEELSVVSRPAFLRALDYHGLKPYRGRKSFSENFFAGRRTFGHIPARRLLRIGFFETKHAGISAYGKSSVLLDMFTRKIITRTEYKLLSKTLK